MVRRLSDLGPFDELFLAFASAGEAYFGTFRADLRGCRSFTMRSKLGLGRLEYGKLHRLGCKIPSSGGGGFTSPLPSPKAKYRTDHPNQ